MESKELQSISEGECFELLKTTLIVLETVSGCPNCAGCKTMAKLAIATIHGEAPDS